ncbi:MAG: 1,4-alpha-glucan branching protein GlgB [Candidatus Acidiferrales bacterium]
MPDESKIEMKSGGGPSTQHPLTPEIEALVRGEHSEPFRILGPHYEEIAGRNCVVVRAFRPRTASLSIVWDRRGEPQPAVRVHPDGFYVAILPLIVAAPPPGQELTPIGSTMYRLRITYPDGRIEEIYDPYSFPPMLTEFDLHLINEGTHYLKYEKLGAHVRELDGIRGVHFAVWAPNARRVSVVGDFNNWDGRAHPMRSRGVTGVWEIFLPGLDEGELYKFEILSRVDNRVELKSDPYGFCAEVRPKTGSIVYDVDRYKWKDADWMARRAKRDFLREPMSIYEVHLGSWRRGGSDGRKWLTYRELAEQLIPYAKWMGFTHLELLPVMEHPYDPSWGYQTVGYFAATTRFGEPDDFKLFVDRCHAEGLGVILDWTPGHFPRDAHGLAFFDGTHLYEHADPRRGAHPDWGTLVFNYGRNEVQNFLVSNAVFWLDKYHVDGLRVDAVASMLYLDYSRKAGEWIPNQYGGRENLEAIAFLKRMNEVVHSRHPGALTIAEESTSWPAVSRPTYVGGLGFDLKWNMGWMNDTLKYFAQDPIYRRYHHNELTFSMMYAFTENFVLPLSHDEVVHGKGSLLAKMPGDDWQKFANLRLLFGYFFAHPGKKLLFMGSELADRHEWSEAHGLEWELEQSPPHRGVQRLITDLNTLYAKEPAFHQVEFDWKGFEWLEVSDVDASTVAFIRRAANRDDFAIVVCNFTPVVRRDYRVGAPEPGFYEESLNTDSAYYEGSDAGNLGGVRAESVPWNNQPYSLKIVLPPLAAVYFKLKR